MDALDVTAMILAWSLSFIISGSSLAVPAVLFSEVSVLLWSEDMSTPFHTLIHLTPEALT